MAQIIPIRPTTPASAPRSFDRAAYRARVEETAQAFLDVAHYCFAELDRIDGDADYEPSDPDEDDGTLEPPMAALATLTGIRWCGHDTEGGAA